MFRNAARQWGGLSVNRTEVSLQRCVFAENMSTGVYCAQRSTVRSEDSMFLSNGNDTFIDNSSRLYSDIPASNLSVGCYNCDESFEFGPVLPLQQAPAELFLTGNDTNFLALQLVRICPFSNMPKAQGFFQRMLRAAPILHCTCYRPLYQIKLGQASLSGHVLAGPPSFRLCLH
jgi:hypothetical protein